MANAPPLAREHGTKIKAGIPCALERESLGLSYCGARYKHALPRVLGPKSSTYLDTTAVLGLRAAPWRACLTRLATLNPSDSHSKDTFPGIAGFILAENTQRLAGEDDTVGMIRNNKETQSSSHANMALVPFRKPLAATEQPEAPTAVLRSYVRDTFGPQSATVFGLVTAGYSGKVPYFVEAPFAHLHAKVAPRWTQDAAGAAARGAFAQEQIGCVLAARIGVGAPVVAVNDRLLVTRYMPGTHVTYDDAQEGSITPTIMARLRELHGAAYDADKARPLESLRAKFYVNLRRLVVRNLCTDRERILAAQVDAADALLRQLTEPAVTHGDFQGRNMRVGLDGSVTFIDFENWGVGEPMQDLAHFTMELLGPEGDITKLLTIYDERNVAQLLPRLHICLFIAHASRLCEWVRWGHEEAWAKDMSPGKIEETVRILARELACIDAYPLRA